MLRSPECSVAFGSPSVPLSLSPPPPMSICLCLSLTCLHYSLSLNSISPSATAQRTYQPPQQMEIKPPVSRAAPQAAESGATRPASQSRPAIGTHLAIVKQEMEQLNWRAAGLRRTANTEYFFKRSQR